MDDAVSRRGGSLGSAHFRWEAGRLLVFVPSLRDAANLVCGANAEERLRILRAVDQAWPMQASCVPGAEERCELYVQWAALEMFSRLRRTVRIPWGVGSVGMAVPPPGGRRKARRARLARAAATRTGVADPRVVLNYVDAGFTDPLLRHLDFPRELARVQKQLRRRVFEEPIAVASADLRVGVQALVGPGLLASTNTIGLVLAYYGAADWSREKGVRRTLIHPWRLRSLLHRLEEDRELDLRTVPWLKGRVRVLQRA